MEKIISFISGINWSDVLVAITSVIATASVLANFTKTEVDNKIIDSIRKIVDFFALNFNVRGKSEDKK